MQYNVESISKPKAKPSIDMLLENIGLGRSHRGSRHARSHLSNHQGSTSGCYDTRHEKNGVHWEGCPNFNPNARQLSPRDQLSMDRMIHSPRGTLRMGDHSPSSTGLSLPLLQRNHSSPTERYLEGSGGLEALAIGGIGPRSRSIVQNPGGLEALQLGRQNPRDRNHILGAAPRGLEDFEELDRRRLQSNVGSGQHEAFEHLINRNMASRALNQEHPNPRRQHLHEDIYPNSSLQMPRYYSPRAPISRTQFQDLGPGPPEYLMTPDYQPAACYPNSPRLSQRSTPRMVYDERNEIAMRSPHPHHINLHQSPSPLMYGEMDSPLTSSRYGSIHSRSPLGGGSNADLQREMTEQRSMRMEPSMMPYTTHDRSQGGSRNYGGPLNTNYQSPYVEDWVSEVGMGPDEMMQRQAAMEGGGFFYDERADIGLDDGYGRSRLV
ncbi:uncharacterized protein EAF01_006807 [Botrytis porri]|uniref:Uncharacterized protein n=1 Tax=Botrytis porri TaxID=87229 RepID=A0A4Z1KM09_9HELO|nr:uncharacterized protein EAF01_006807 [Botrytis porri]KAF7903758.1 hypothetical protein EAF01_006807 [Botrytis porri]TGO86376.1 hypothetical protein BPOR_0309g00040 [Botrytis porri]